MTTDVRTAKYEVPVEARLVVEIGEDGEHGRRPATTEDLKRFGYVDPHEAYARFETWVFEVLGLSRTKDITETVANPTRYAIECALHYQHMPEVDTALDLRRLQALADAVPTLLNDIRALEEKAQQECAVDPGEPIVAMLSTARLREVLARVLEIDAVIEQLEG
jgi:hypothetical protein